MMATTKEMLGKISSQVALEALEKNQRAVVQKLSSVCCDAEIASALLVCMQISIDLSVQIITRALETVGVIGLPEDDEPIIWMDDR